MAILDCNKWQVVLVDLNPIVEKETSRVRPCPIISPDTANTNLSSVIIALLAAATRNIPTRIYLHFDGMHGEICFHQIKAIGRKRIVKLLGAINHSE